MLFSAPTVTLILLLLQLLPAFAYRRHPLPRALVRRQSDTCDQQDSVRCPNVAAEFCCPSDAECIPLENATSVICCNKDDFCDEIHPVACPDTESSVQKLETCGPSCCPIGFECSGAKDKCLMKKDNLPDKYKEKQKADQNKKEDNLAVCRDILGEESGGSSCKEITGKGAAVGFFPGMLLGVAIMFLYTKMVEMKTRRRSIKSFGPSAFPPPQEDLLDDISEKDVTIQQPWRIPSPAPGSAGFSPNLGPVIEPARDRSRTRLDVESRANDSRRSSVQQSDVSSFRWDGSKQQQNPFASRHDPFELDS